uniref:Uncharacterized protein n=1 Tax=Oscillatoriales cyanobacterium SpSt-418 TaxID=2282169 RepID=A0A7C3KEQ4_9CYAN
MALKQVNCLVRVEKNSALCFNATNDFSVAQVIATGTTQLICFTPASILTQKNCQRFDNPEGSVLIIETKPPTSLFDTSD